MVAGSIFTFSLTLGDYIIPEQFGNSSFFIGRAVNVYQGTSGNVPLAAAFTVVPIADHGHLSDAGAQGWGRSMRSNQGAAAVS